MRAASRSAGARPRPGPGINPDRLPEEKDVPLELLPQRETVRAIQTSNAAVDRTVQTCRVALNLWKPKAEVEVALGTGHEIAQAHFLDDPRFARFLLQNPLPALWNQRFLFIRHGLTGERCVVTVYIWAACASNRTAPRSG